MAGDDYGFGESDVERCTTLGQRGAAVAEQSLTMMLGKPITFAVRRVALVPIEDVCSGPLAGDVPVVCIALRIAGEGAGYVVFIMYEQAAKRINEVLWGGIPLDDGILNVSNVSALKEMANIVGSGFLNALADALKIELRPSEPVFVYEMLGATLDTLLLEQSLESDVAFVIDSSIQSAEADITLDFLFLPAPEMITALTVLMRP